MNKTIVEERKRSGFGKVIKLLFYLFNAFMALWFVLWMINLSNIPECVGEFADACKAGQFAGGFTMFAVIAFIWLAVGGIFALLLLATRGKKIVRETSTET